MPPDDITKFVSSIHSAFSLAVAQSFVIGVAAALIAAIAASGMKELKLRQETAAQSAAAATKADPAGAAAADGGRPAVPAAE